MVPIDPWVSKDSLRWFLLKFNERHELDALIKEYVSDILGHKIVMSPSIGPYGEKGKDMVAIEDEEAGNYCSYVIKRGTLQENIDGPFGIIKQMRDALTIDLEIERYRGRKRTVVVVHNGSEGYRGAIKKFEIEKARIEAEIGKSLLLRPISRWDIEEITDRLFKRRKHFQESEINKITLDRMESAEQFVANLKQDIEDVLSNSKTKPTKSIVIIEKAYKNIESIERKSGPFNKPI